MTETTFDELTLAELRRFEQGLEGSAKILHLQRPKGITRAEAHAVFDRSRAEAVKAYRGALDELITAMGNLPGPGYTLNLPRRYAALAALHVLASDQFADAAHARIDAVPLGGGITYESAEEQKAARDKNNAEIARKSDEAKRVGEIIKRREEEERQRELEEERERAQARRAEQIREDQEHTGRVLRERA
jgi:hypothetical protein